MGEGTPRRGKAGKTREHKLPLATIARFGSAKRRFAGRKAFMAYLKRLGLAGLEVKPDPVQFATEGAL